MICPRCDCEEPLVRSLACRRDGNACNHTLECLVHGAIASESWNLALPLAQKQHDALIAREYARETEALPLLSEGR